MNTMTWRVVYYVSIAKPNLKDALELAKERINIHKLFVNCIFY